MSNTYAGAEARFGHPLQYALVGYRATYVGDTEDMTNAEVRQQTGADQWTPVERYNRCPTCEQWSPCDVRREAS